MPEGKAGTRKGRLNYAAEFKQRLAEAACQRDVSIARLALEHGLNANMGKREFPRTLRQRSFCNYLLVSFA